jgi:large subunit ribosomal protein L11
MMQAQQQKSRRTTGERITVQNCFHFISPIAILLVAMSLVRHVRLRVPSGNARPGPSIGQALGPLGINMAEFCKQFNERTQDLYEKDVPLGVKLAAMSDRSFTFQVRSPPTAYLIKRCLGKQSEKGPSEPTIEKPWGYITPEAVYEIAKLKQTGTYIAVWHSIAL